MLAAVCCGTIPHPVSAQGTKLWTQSRYDEMERGTSDGVAIRNDGRLEVAPASKLLYTTSGSYVWSVTSDSAGNAYLGRGGTTGSSAIITKVTPDGVGTDIFAGKELAVQSLKCAPDGTLFAATSPDGKVYRIRPDKTSSVVFDPSEISEKPKYLWDLALSASGDLYIAAGAPAAVYKVSAAGGKARLLFRTSDQHIRCLLLTSNGMLYAGSDGAGVIYRMDTARPAATLVALYSAAKREITSLALDAAGNLYAAGVGTKGNVPLPNLPVTGATNVTITFVQPGSSSAVSTSTVIPEGSEIYKIAADGSPMKLLGLKEDVVYALTMHNNSLLAGSGNRGRIYSIDTNVPGRWTDIAHLDAAQAIAFAPQTNGLLIATSNSGRVFHLSDSGSTDATFTSAVFDAQTFSKWGRAEVLPVTGTFDLYIRTGNVEDPALGWSEWMRATPNADSSGAPSARYAQWKAVLHTSATLESVALNYLAKNLAPMVDEVVTQPGARVIPTPPATNTTVPVNFPAAASATPPVIFQVDTAATPLVAQKDKSAVTIRWSAHDDNGDELIFAAFYKGEGEANWRLLKDKITDRFYSFDASLLPDGTYTAKVMASDSPSHTATEALTGERVSSIFVIDTTPPVPGILTATMEAGKIHAHFEAKDTTSPISRAEYSVDAGTWQYLEPSGSISDSLAEHYDFVAAIPSAIAPVTDAKEHIIAVRVYDRYDNVATAKAVVR